LNFTDSSPEAQPKYIKGGKRYGRRSLPEFQASVEDFAEVTVIEPLGEEGHPRHVPSGDCEEVSRGELCPPNVTAPRADLGWAGWPWGCLSQGGGRSLRLSPGISGARSTSFAPAPMAWEAGDEPGSRGDVHQVLMPPASPRSWASN